MAPARSAPPARSGLVVALGPQAQLERPGIAGEEQSARAVGLGRQVVERGLAGLDRGAAAVGTAAQLALDAELRRRRPALVERPERDDVAAAPRQLADFLHHEAHVRRRL